MNNKHKRPILIAAAILGAALLCGFTYSQKEGGKIWDATEQVQTISYKGHSYICYRTYVDVRGGCGLGASIVHDPDCPCGKGGK